MFVTESCVNAVAVDIAQRSNEPRAGEHPSYPSEASDLCWRSMLYLDYVDGGIVPVFEIISWHVAIIIWRMHPKGFGRLSDCDPS